MEKSEIIYGREYKSKTFKDIHLSLTNRCNLSCKHCALVCSPEENDYMDTKQIFKLIDNLTDMNVRCLVLSGGEPLVREDFCEIVNYIKKRLPSASIFLSTNGTLISDENIDFITSNFDKIDISLDGIDEETCSKIRGRGVFTKVLKVVDELHSRNFYNINLSMVFGEKNYKMIEKFKELNKRLNTISVERCFIPSGRGLVNREIYSDDNSNLPLIIPKMQEIEINNNSKKTIKFGSCACNACIEQIFINYDGKIYPCPSLIEEDYLIGSIFDEKIINSLRNNKFDNNIGFNNLSNLYPYNFEKCKECDVNIFCLKCPARVNNIKNSDDELDIWCKLNKQSLELAIWGGKIQVKFNIFVTERCNLRCRYCYEQGIDRIKDMSIYTANKTIDFICKKIQSEEIDIPLYIVFHGGEPLVNFELIKYIHKELSEKVKERNIIYNLTTNATILDEEKINFICKNIDNISISIDGTSKSHNKNRVFTNGLGSYDTTIKNAKKFLDKNKNIRVRMTYSTNTVSEIYDGVNQIASYGFRNIVLAPDFRDTNWKRSDIDVINQQISKLISLEKVYSNIDINLLDRNSLNTRKGDCFGGIVSFTIDVNGDIFPCVVCIGNNDLRIGSVFDEDISESKKIELINIYTSENKDCEGCSRQEFCDSRRCKIINKTVTGDFNKPIPILCALQNVSLTTTKKLKDTKSKISV